MVPLVTVSIPPKRFNKVDFPAPEGPNITTNSPLLISKDTLSKALSFFSPTLYVLVTFLSSINFFMIYPFPNMKLLSHFDFIILLFILWVNEIWIIFHILAIDLLPFEMYNGVRKDLVLWKRLEHLSRNAQ